MSKADVTNQNGKSESEGTGKKLETVDDNSQVKPKSRSFLYIATCVANITSIIVGISIGWTSPLNPKHTTNSENHLPEPATLEEASWIGAFLPAGAIFGPFIAGPAVHYIGRKAALMVSVVPSTVAFVMLAFAGSVPLILTARFFLGISVGAIFTVVPIYVAEISDDSVRGALGSIMQLFIVWGILFAYCVGPYTPIMYFNLISVVFPVMFVIIMSLFIPETPQYYISKNKLEEASKALAKIRGSNEKGVEDELFGMKAAVDKAIANKGGITDLVKDPAARKALFLSMILVSFQQLCGSCPFLFYAQSIFEDTGIDMPADITTIIVGVVQVLSCFITPAIVERSGRRMLLILSGIFMCISEAILAYYFYKLSSGDDVSSLFWLPVSCLIVFIVFFRLGYGPLPFPIMGELFPTNVKSAALTILACTSWLLGFVMAKGFSTMVAYVGAHGCFAIFSVFSLIAAIAVYIFLPETSGKSMQEIQEMLAGKKEVLQ